MLILDEPTNGLDPAGMAEMRDLTRRLSEAGCADVLLFPCSGGLEQVSLLAQALRAADTTPVAVQGGDQRFFPHADLSTERRNA